MACSRVPRVGMAVSGLAIMAALGCVTPLAAQPVPPAQTQADARATEVQPAPPSPPKPAKPAPRPAKKAAKTDLEEAEEADEVAPVIVKAKKPPPLPGAVVGDIKPELSLAPADIQSYGVSTVTELLNELSPETRSDRGRGASSPVVLLNGHRISGFNEIQNIPTEAILRVDILPEEVSLKYGYTADQRVVNIVLRRRFRAITGELQGGGPTEGGEVTGQAEMDLFHVRGDSRLNMDLKYQGNSAITDAARGLIETTPSAPYALGGNVTSTTPGGQIDPGLSALAGQPVTVAGVPTGASNRALTLGDFAATANQPNVTHLGDDRTLSPSGQSITGNAVWARPIFWGINATVNGTLGATGTVSEQGLQGVSLTVPAGDPFSPFSEPVALDRYGPTPLHQYVNGWTAHLGSTLNKDTSDWRLSLTDAYDHSDSQTDTDVGINAGPLQNLLNADSATFNPFTPFPNGLISTLPQSTGRSISDSANIQLLGNGPILEIPAGSLYVSAKAGDTESFQASSSLRNGNFQAVNLNRNDANAQLNVDLPLTSREHHILEAIGDLSVNTNGAVDQVSDYGTLKAFGYGVNWTPIPGYNLIISHTNDQAAPTIQQLGGPMVATPGVTVLDYATGQTVNVTQISGGNPNLVADNRNVTKFGLTLKPWPSENFTFTANYIKSRIDHPIETFPAASAAIEAAFASRFIRNTEGELTEEDERPVNFAQSYRTELRWGFNYSRPIGPQPPPRDLNALRAARERRNANGGNGGGGPDGGPGGEGRGGSGNRGAGFGGGRGGGGFGGQAAGGRLQIAVYHTIYFEDRMLVAPGGPTLDLLNGAPASSTGGQYRNEVEGQLGVTMNGLGARISADWRSATYVLAGPGSASGNLNFSDITTINLRLFNNFGQQRSILKVYPWLRGTRVTLNITNLFDQRVDVRDALGVTPLSYQAGDIDPVGRSISLSLRKLFF